MTRQVPVIDIASWFDGDEAVKNSIARKIDGLAGAFMIRAAVMRALN